MEKSKSLPEHSFSYNEGRFEFEDRPKSYSFNGPAGKGEGFASSSNPELQRRKRVASYNMYAMEGKVKTTLRNSVKWVKGKFTTDHHSYDE